jgi:hypothetical protein
MLEYPYFCTERVITQVWQHMVLLVIRQYVGKSYRLFVDWLVEAYYLRIVLQSSRIPHFTTLQKFYNGYKRQIYEDSRYVAKWIDELFVVFGESSMSECGATVAGAKKGPLDLAAKLTLMKFLLRSSLIVQCMPVGYHKDLVNWHLL